MKFIFARVGGLSPVKQKGYDASMPTFHCPPARKGIYAFMWPYIEPFLLGGDFPGQNRNACSTSRLDQWKRDGMRKFTHDGELWSHFYDTAKELHCGIEYKGSWVKVHVNDYGRIIKKVFHDDIKCVMGYGGEAPSDPYKWGQGGNICRDSLEIFIERPNPGKVERKEFNWRK